VNSASSVIALDESAVVATSAGKVAGYIRKGIFTFKGIPYGDTTEGANRFMPPVKPKPWSGVRSSGNTAPVCRHK
jgi:para-nitrobenzyl esterase